ncbi:hypothetical protein IEQ34_007698 [Dendrobium chrysotoxum]|uniref:Uncharacterized protein n=1 Tax=Dendrobium chrysotoxum TaxID=161865 RepID=A0AAV7H3R4_DENCH|nr:hypothetical protein IEQ34_007698 [Dendrobium chrysotoxum]
MKCIREKFQIVILGQNDIMPILRLSYVYLPQPLQSYFTSCCIFSQDQEFDKDDLYSFHLTYDKDEQDFGILTRIFETSEKHLLAVLLRSLSDLYHLMFMMYDKGDLHIHDNFLPKDLNNLLIYIT